MRAIDRVLPDLKLLNLNDANAACYDEFRYSGIVNQNVRMLFADAKKSYSANRLGEDVGVGDRLSEAHVISRNLLASLTTY